MWFFSYQELRVLFAGDAKFIYHNNPMSWGLAQMYDSPTSLYTPSWSFLQICPKTVVSSILDTAELIQAF